MTRKGTLLVLVLLISAGLAVSLYVELVEHSSVPPGGSSIFGSPPLSIGSPTVATDGSTTWLSFPVGGVDPSIQLEEIAVHIADPTGRNVSAQSDWNLTFDSTAGVLGIYSWSHGDWLVGGTSMLSTEDSFLFSLRSAEADQLVGDAFVLTVSGPGGLHAECSATIP